MNVAELNHKLIAAARANPPSDRVPYAFEKRILARLAGQRMPDDWALWARALWRAAAPCVAIMMLFSVWSYLAPNGNVPAGDLSHFISFASLPATE